MNTQQFIDSIKTIPYRKLDNEFNFAVNSPEQVTPALLEVITNTLSNRKKDDDYMAHHFAIYFLGYFREQQAFPLIIELLSKMDDNLFCDEIESMPNILASTFNGDINLLYQLIENDNAYEFSRVAALETLVVLVMTNQVKRSEVIEYLRKLITSPPFTEDATDMTLWAIYMAFLLYPEELVSDIRLRFYLIGVDNYFEFEEIITPEDFEKGMKRGENYIKDNFGERQNYHLITSIEDEFKDWRWFEPQKDYMFNKDQVKLSEEHTQPSAQQENDSAEEGAGSEDYYFIGDEKHMSYCHKHYGDFNEAGLKSLQDKYDTDHIYQAEIKVSELCGQLEALKNHLDILRTAARDIIEDDKPWGKSYYLDEHGDIGDFASDVYDTASSIECSFAEVTKRLAPLSRLMPIDEEYDDCPFHKAVDDWLDRPEGYHGESRYDFSDY